MSNHSASHNEVTPAPIFQAPVPPNVTIPSTDFGGPILSVFTETDDDGPICDMSDGLPFDVIDVMAAIRCLSEGLFERASRDAMAIMLPGQPYVAPRSPERWMQLLDQTMADLAVCRRRMAQEINAE